ncbi:hypothetical protein AHAS_Ahas15G0218500 [Arachis hypogaea]
MEPRAALVVAALRRGGRPRLNDAGRERKTRAGGAASSRRCRATDRRRFAIAFLASCHRTLLSQSATVASYKAAAGGGALSSFTSASSFWDVIRSHRHYWNCWFCCSVLALDPL